MLTSTVIILLVQTTIRVSSMC